MINHHQNSYYSFSLNTYKEISISLDSLYARDLGGMKSRKKNYKIRKSVASDPETRDDLLIFLYFNTCIFMLHKHRRKVIESFQPDGVDFWYFKLTLFDPTKF